MDIDVAVIGAGPVGLCMARALAGRQLRVALIDPQSEQALSQPAFDGREIALTHASHRLLSELDVMPRIDPQAISPLRDARVVNGPSLQSMTIDHALGGRSALGFLVANHRIREAAFRSAREAGGTQWFLGEGVEAARPGADHVELQLSSGRILQARLVLAADGRFSPFRRSQGISAAMHDFGKAMMVCTMAHEKPHDHVALEWFDFGQTLALLPMNGPRSSVVLTLAAHQIDELIRLPAEQFNQQMAERFHHRLGAMTLESQRISYPLVSVYADHFVGLRFALLGDAAVGMHPVTAHGFNFGLKAVDLLAQGIGDALVRGRDIGNRDTLATYQRRLRMATRPLFLATHAIAKLYTSESRPALSLRANLLRLGEQVTPFKRVIAGSLTGSL